MNDFCIITDDEQNHLTIHYKSQPTREKSIYSFVKDEYILKYFQDNINKKIFLKEGTVCEVLFSFTWSYNMYIIRDVVSKKLAVLGEEGICKYSAGKKAFFDILFVLSGDKE